MIILLVVIGIALGCGLMGAITGIMIDRYLRDTREIKADIAEYEKHGKHAKTQPRTTHVRNPNTGTWHLPIPGPPKPQPGRDSGAGTITFSTGPIGIPPKTREELSTTGEINIYKSRTDDFIARMALD